MAFPWLNRGNPNYLRYWDDPPRLWRPHLQDQLADVVSLLVVPAIATSLPGVSVQVLVAGSLLVVMVFVRSGEVLMIKTTKINRKNL